MSADLDRSSRLTLLALVAPFELDELLDQKFVSLDIHLVHINRELALLRAPLFAISQTIDLILHVSPDNFLYGFDQGWVHLADKHPLGILELIFQTLDLALGFDGSLFEHIVCERKP
jgi:hypothetical protein